MTTTMFELNIKKINSTVQNCVSFWVESGEEGPLYIEATHTRGTNVVKVQFGSNILSCVGSEQFEVPSLDMDEKEVKNAVLDWILTEKGTKTLKKAFKTAQKHYKEA